jgi:hypothetical protein
MQLLSGAFAIFVGTVAFLVADYIVDPFGAKARKRKWASAAIACVLAFLVGQFFLFPFLDAQATERSTQELVERIPIILAADPALAQYAENDPDAYSAFQSNLEHAARQGKTDVQILHMLEGAKEQIIQRYASAADASTVEYWRSYILVAWDDLFNQPQYCYGLMVEGEVPLITEMIVDDTFAVNTIKANGLPSDGDWEQASQDAAAIMSKIKGKHADALVLLKKTSLAPDESMPLCPFLKDYLTEVLRLPRDREANLFRTIFYAKQPMVPPAQCKSIFCL